MRNSSASRASPNASRSSPRRASVRCDPRCPAKAGVPFSNKANLIASKSYNTQSDYRFDMKTFMELRNAQSVVIAYDGINPTPPMFCYLKPYYNNPNDSYFVQLAKGKL